MNLLNLEEEKFKTVEIQGHEFKVKYIDPMARVRITQERMRLQGGNPVEALTEADFLYFENIAIVNMCIEELPDGFSKGDSCITWGDIDLINELATAIRKHSDKISEKLKKNRPTVGGAQR